MVLELPRPTRTAVDTMMNILKVLCGLWACTPVLLPHQVCAGWEYELHANKMRQILPSDQKHSIAKVQTLEFEKSRTGVER